MLGVRFACIMRGVNTVPVMARNNSHTIGCQALKQAWRNILATQDSIFGGQRLVSQQRSPVNQVGDSAVAGEIAFRKTGMSHITIRSAFLVILPVFSSGV